MMFCSKMECGYLAYLMHLVPFFYAILLAYY